MTLIIANYLDHRDGHGPDPCKEVAHGCTRFPCYLGMEINQCRDPLNSNKDCQVVFSVPFDGTDP